MVHFDGKVKDLLPYRDKQGHKGTFGKLLLIAGSENMAGAAILAAKAAYRTGCGMVKIISPAANRVILQIAIPEALYAPLENINWKDEIAWADVVAVGPGIGVGENAAKAVSGLVSEIDKPLVVDADAINLLAQNAEELALLSRKDCAVILTPHPAERKRLCIGAAGNFAFEQTEAEELFADINMLSRRLNAIVVAKDAQTKIAFPDSADIFQNCLGNSGMATAGSGDVLTGIISGLLCQKVPEKEAAIRGVLLHACAGDFVAKQKGEHYLMASDLCDAIGQE